ncbi:MAG TPA: hypothetical protein VL358_03920 [Caulobacteraceae bacterium]|jgi:hypothetical protein|nr:hypothetical protein [Caulobacteraceae bacterium]
MQHSHISTWRGAEKSASFAALECTLPDAIAPEPSKGTWLDEWLDLREPEGQALTSEVLALTAAFETRVRKRRQEAQICHQIIVRRILANGLRCHHFRRPSLVSYYRKADGYKDSPPWLSGEAMSRTVDLLVAAGLLDGTRGQRRGFASTYSITDRLCEIAIACGVTDNSFSTLRLPLKRLVRLREGNYETPEVAFPQTAETIRWAALVRAYNAFLAQQDISLPLTADEKAKWVRHWNNDKKEGAVLLCQPELFQTDLYRQFANGSFGAGGRLYGGWWINTPKALRRKIAINGQATVELDFSGCAIRMLYHERGLDYRDDPYQLGAIVAYEAEAGLPPSHFREGVKAMTQALINDRDGKRPDLIRLPDGLSFYPRFKRSEVRRMIEEKHAPIVDAFGTGAGLRLQRIDSDLALAIITKLMRQKVVALPIHDSFLVGEQDEVTTHSTMNEVYRDKLGFAPLINRIYPGPLI